MAGVLVSGDMNTNPSLIMVDMGGVLALHTDTSLERALLLEFGIDSVASFSQLEPSLVDLLQLHSKAVIDEDALWARFSDLTGVPVPPHDGSLWAKYFNPLMDPEMEKLLGDLKAKQYRIVCATNTEPAHYAYHQRMNHYGIFDAVYASCVIGKAKPELDFFTHILAAENVEPRQVLFIDDSKENCDAASSVGINAIPYANCANLRQRLEYIGIL